PTDQTNLLAQRDYALGYSGALGALVHFSAKGRPADLVAPLGMAAAPNDVDAFLAASVDGKPATDGMYLVVGGDRAPDSFHCGYDLAPPPAGAPLDAWDDAPVSLAATG